jgi:hypothetical protein
VQATTKCLSLSIFYLPFDASLIWNGLTGHWLCDFPVAD